MSLRDWHKRGWLRPHETNREQIADLLAIVERDLLDARSARLSADWQFGIAYNAALKLCTILLYAEGYRAARTMAHFRTVQAMPVILGEAYRGDADYLDMCRSKRNTAEYDAAGRVSAEEARELLGFAGEFKGVVVSWLRENYPECL